MKYNHKKIEKKWQKVWEESRAYDRDIVGDKNKEKFYMLDMFPYPSGDGLHMGHTESYTASDIMYRYKRLQGFDVLHPQGFDSFGLPAENYAIKTGVHPKETTKTNANNYIQQMKMLGLGHDLNHLVYTSDSSYYKWTQWIFGKFFENNLVEQKTSKINWCPSCNTGIANEQVENGKCERCKTDIEQREIPGWFFKITDFADDLIKDLDKVDWPESTKKNQRNWIGKSVGAKINFKLKILNSNSNSNKKISNDKIEVFTTRPDTLFGATYLVVAPEHELVENEKLRIKNYDEVDSYVEEAKNKAELDRLEAKEKTGVKLEGVTAINPANGEEIPIFVADYVLGGYGTGAIMAVPAHDERDFEFATHYNESRNNADTASQSQTNAELSRTNADDTPKDADTATRSLINADLTQKNAEKIEIKQVVLEKIEKTSEQIKTLKTYNANIQKYIDKTPAEVGGKSKMWIDKFLSLINKDKAIFEIGTAMGRDADYFQKKGFNVIRTDITFGFVKYQKDNGNDAQLFDILEDGMGDNINSVFANATFLHLTKQQFPVVLQKINRVLLDNGLLAFSLKKGEGEKISSKKLGAERFFSYWREGEIEKVLNDNGYDVIFLNSDDKWIHIIVKKIVEAGVFIGNGIMINSGKFDGMDSEEAKKAITEFVGGEMTTNYRLRDWSISRQRYWGCPIPIVYSPEGEAKFVGEENLPWTLPEDVDFVPDGTAPLVKSKELKERTEKLFGKGWTPEVDTMDTFVDSSWYFLRYPDTENEKEFCSAEKLKRWLPVDLYIGGAEHTYMHLLFARFFVKAMNKMGLIEFDEPFMKLRHQGMVLDKDGVKMSKSKGNVINPNDMVEMFGADATRMYMMFAGPLEDEVMFKQEGVKGVFRFLEKVWRLAQEKDLIDCGAGRCGEIPKEIPPVLHKTIKKVGEDIETLSYNTAIAQMMIFVNEATKHKVLPKGAFKKFLIILAPFAPHIAEELWSQVGGEDSIFNQSWPEYNPEMVQDNLIEMPIQVNGKVRDKIKVSVDISEDEAKEKALASEKIKKHIEGKKIKKVIFVKGRLISVVV